MSLGTLGFPVARVVDNELRTTEGLTVAAILGLLPG